MTASDYVQLMDSANQRHIHFSLAIAVMSGRASLIHHSDPELLAKLETKIADGGVPFAIFAIVDVPGHGVCACASSLCEIPGGAELIDIELRVMNDLLRSSEELWTKNISAAVLQ